MVVGAAGLVCGLVVAHADGGSTTPARPTFTAPPPSGGPAPAVAVLVPRYQSQGSATTPAFSATGPGWHVAWIVDCGQAAGARATFRITTVPGARTLVDSDTATARGVVSGDLTGAVRLDVTTQPGCRWALGVSGEGTAG